MRCFLIRDEELNRLIKYAQGMGVFVRFKPYVKGSKVVAEWATDGSEIIMYTTSKHSKLDKILDLIHELGHHRAFVENGRKVDLRANQALDSDQQRDRKYVLDSEIADSAYWEDIYRDTGCKFNIEKLRKQREFDIWTYEFVYKHGRDANGKEKRDKLKELRKKYGC